MHYQIVIVGTGALGKRHLSSILDSEMALDVYCYDINPNALEGFEWEDLYHNKSLKIVPSFDELPEQIDFAVFAMTSKGRREMFDRLVNATKVRNILFEKVLFQREEDYRHVGQRLKELDIHAWVNCARRQMDSYQNLRKELEDAKEMRIFISGGEWGLACNAIHELDLIEFLAGSNETVVDKLNLQPLIAESKRPGFKEVYGTISGSSGKCSEYTINCMDGSKSPVVMMISSDIGQYIVIESKAKLICMTAETGYEFKEKPFEIMYQSKMTQAVMEDILLRGVSRLAEYDESARLHLQLVRPLIEFFERKGMGAGICPIT